MAGADDEVRASTGAARGGRAAAAPVKSGCPCGRPFLRAQFFRVGRANSWLDAGIRTLPLTAMPILVAPIGRVLRSRPHSGRAGAPGGGAGLACGGHRAGRPIQGARPGLRHGGWRNGARGFRKLADK